MRSRFDQELEGLHHRLIQMGSLCEKAISMSSEALEKGDTHALEAVSPLEADIDHMEREIEALCLKLLLQQQPVAKDLRLISAALKMITDMERIGNMSADIAEVVGYVGGKGSQIKVLVRMAEEACLMVTRSVDAYVKSDYELAQSVIAQDDVVDSLFSSVKKTLAQIIAARPEDSERALDVLMIAKYYERIADHAVNIASWVLFSLTGTH
ncbi:MAG: phosphate signaling complex protein PhoU [Sphaerochaetaceae bacterium]|jgi:phosphate transport system protein|nr:phosphate signaling complex protein PhoU [Sphaerochaetaceae bacterium]